MFFQSLAAKYFLTLILWDFSMQCVFFIILHLLGLPVGTFCVKVALMRIELRLDMEVTMALVYFKNC